LSGTVISDCYPEGAQNGAKTEVAEIGNYHTLDRLAGPGGEKELPELEFEHTNSQSNRVEERVEDR